MQDRDGWRGMNQHESPCPRDRRVERNKFFDGKLLTAEDLEAEQDYFLDKHHAHNRLHGYGTVCGLGVASTDPPSDVVIVQPGVAVDCCGRELVVRAPIVVNMSEVAGDESVYVTLEYGEDPVDPTPAPSSGDDTSSPPGRIREEPRARVARTRPKIVTGEPGGQLDGVVACSDCHDARVLLAAVARPARGPITSDRIDNSVRRALPGHLLAGSDPERDAILERLQRRVSALSVAVGGLAVGVTLALTRNRP